MNNCLLSVMQCPELKETIPSTLFKYGQYKPNTICKTLKENAWTVTYSKQEEWQVLCCLLPCKMVCQVTNISKICYGPSTRRQMCHQHSKLFLNN